MKLLSAAGKNITSESYTFVSNDALLEFEGTFSGESVYVERLMDSGSYQTLEDGTITYPTEKIIRLYRGAVIRVRTSNGAGTPSITVRANHRDQ